MEKQLYVLCCMVGSKVSNFMSRTTSKNFYNIGLTMDNFHLCIVYKIACSIDLLLCSLVYLVSCEAIKLI